jgi:hypothetical protein
VKRHRVAESRLEKKAHHAEREQRQDERQLARIFDRKADARKRRHELRVAERRDHHDGARTWQALLDRRDDDRPIRLRRINDHDRNLARSLFVGDQFVPDRYDDYIPLSYRARYYDTPNYYYRFDDDDGYLYRVNRSDNLITGLLPLFGGGYGIGQPMPLYYQSSWVPNGYRTLYYDTPDYYYRYAGNSIYQVDAKSQLIMALVGLVTGQNFNIGQQMPLGYDAYNVPYAYRSRYYDTADNWYRYDDGYIYQVDPYTRVVEAGYPIYDDGYYVGQEWPVAYPDYNVPYGYRDVYYDTPQWDYRFANGAIYQVDPQTQLIKALVTLVTGQRFSVGQPLPVGYDAYNVPYAYRDRYYDTADSWYRYNDGFVYQVDPNTGLIERAIDIYA